MLAHTWILHLLTPGSQRWWQLNLTPADIWISHLHSPELLLLKLPPLPQSDVLRIGSRSTLIQGSKSISSFLFSILLVSQQLFQFSLLYPWSTVWSNHSVFRVTTILLANGSSIWTSKFFTSFSRFDFYYKLYHASITASIISVAPLHSSSPWSQELFKCALFMHVSSTNFFPQACFCH